MTHTTHRIAGWIRRAALPLLILILLGASALFQQRLHEAQRRAAPNAAVQTASPRVTFITMVLGGFRGLVADALWIRAARMQQEGRYFEMVQLANWITQLEPQFTEVWAFSAWNLAYNISIYFNRPEDRWRWVQSGIALLRDEGLAYNPHEPDLYYELAWMFAHKIGSFTDNAHIYYKEQWAEAMRKALGGPHPDYLHPPAPERLAPYRMNIAFMQAIEEQYGPLDWLRPQTQAIYWAFQGLPFADPFMRTRLQRLIYQSMAVMTLGETTPDADEADWYPPNPALLPYTLRAYEQAIQDAPDNPSLQQAYVNFLEMAVEIYRTAGDQNTVQKLFQSLEKYTAPQ
ncbi:MAG: hypothetical protein PHP44_07840 [Kiritimatiellae bacterium]|nr:hypothetical protein [Kiritimatiellia bacterium]